MSIQAQLFQQSEHWTLFKHDLHTCLVIIWLSWCCSSGRGQKLIPANAEDAVGIDVDEEQEGEEEPPLMLNGTAPCVWGCCRNPISPLTHILLAFSLSPFIHSSIQSSFIHPRRTFCSPMPETHDPRQHCMLHNFPSAQNIRPTALVMCVICKKD